jgi:hypothetical protein
MGDSPDRLEQHCEDSLVDVILFHGREARPVITTMIRPEQRHFRFMAQLVPHADPNPILEVCVMSRADSPEPVTADDAAGVNEPSKNPALEAPDAMRDDSPMRCELTAQTMFWTQSQRRTPTFFQRLESRIAVSMSQKRCYDSVLIDLSRLPDESAEEDAEEAAIAAQRRKERLDRHVSERVERERQSREQDELVEKYSPFFQVLESSQPIVRAPDPVTSCIPTAYPLRAVPAAIPVKKPDIPSSQKKSLSDPSLQKKTTSFKPAVASLRKEKSPSVPSESPSGQGCPPLSQGFRWFCCVDGCSHSRKFLRPDVPPPPLRRGRGKIIDDTRRWKIPRGNPMQQIHPYAIVINAGPFDG